MNVKDTLPDFFLNDTVKPVLSGHSKIDKTRILKTRYLATGSILSELLNRRSIFSLIS